MHINLGTRIVVAIERVAAVGIGVLTLADVVATVTVAAVIAIVERGNHFSNLRSDVGIAVHAAGVVHTHTNGTCHTVHLLRVATATATETGHNYIENGTGSLGIIFGTRVGNDLNLLDHACGHGLENLLHVLATECRIGMAIAIHLERGRPLDANLVLAVDRDHGHFLEHVEHIIGAAVGIALHIIGYAVNLSAHQRFLSSDGDTCQHIGRLFEHNVAQQRIGLGLRHAELLAGLFLAHSGHLEHIATILAQHLVKTAVVFGDSRHHDLGCITLVEDAHCGIGFAHACCIVHLAFHTELRLRHEGGQGAT